MRIVHVVIALIVVLMTIVALCVAAIWAEKKFPGESYDERQKLSRGRAYRVSFWTGFAYYSIVALLLIGQVDGQKRVEPWLLVFWGMMVQVLVNHTYCLLTHSALPFSQKGSATIYSHLVSGCIFLSSLWLFAMKRDGLSLLGHGSATLAFLTIGICHLYLAMLYILQSLRDRKG